MSTRPKFTSSPSPRPFGDSSGHWNQSQPMTPEALERLRYRYLSIPQQTATRTLQFHQMRAKAQHGAA